MEFHAIADEWPLIEGDDFVAFVADVRSRGFENRTVYLYDGKILDGRNRYRAAVELGLVDDLCFETFRGTEDDARKKAESLNDHRRHESRESRVARAQSLRDQGLSTRAIAERLGVDHSTVVRDLKTGGADAPPAPTVQPALPERAAKVLELKEKGHTDKEVAEELGVSTKTVQRAKVDIAEKQHEAAEQAKEAAPKVIGRDGKKHPAKRPEVKPAKRPEAEQIQTEEERERNAMLRRKALDGATAATNALKGIGKRNPFRNLAYQEVLAFIDSNP